MKNLIGLIFVVIPLIVTGQCKDLTWPEDPDIRSEAESRVARYTDLLNEGSLNETREPISWLLKNNPEFNESLYINGIKVYNELTESAKDAPVKMHLFDSLMRIYDQRIAQCGDHGQLLARKAYDAYKHTVRNADRLLSNLELFDMAFEEYGSDIGEYMLLPYMNLARYNYKPAGNITEEEMAQRYELIQEIISKKSTAGELENEEKITDTVDDIYFSLILGDDVDCATIREKLGPRLERNPSDLDLAKQIFGLMVKNKCTDDPLWLESSEIIVENDPNYGLYKIIGQKFMGNDELEKAMENFQKAASLADDKEKKSEIYLIIGSLYEKKGANAEVYPGRSISHGSLQCIGLSLLQEQRRLYGEGKPRT